MAGNLSKLLDEEECAARCKDKDITTYTYICNDDKKRKKFKKNEE